MRLQKEDWMLTAAHGMGQCDPFVAGLKEVEVPREYTGGFHVDGC